MAKCIGFQMKKAIDAMEHMDYELICNYGNYAYGHYLHTWDDGKRLLCRCRKCGGYILIQQSEFHSFSGNDGYYTDYFPVDSIKDAEEINKNYDGFGLEKNFPEKYIIKDGFRLGWAKGEE